MPAQDSQHCRRTDSARSRCAPGERLPEIAALPVDTIPDNALLVDAVSEPDGVVYIEVDTPPDPGDTATAAVIEATVRMFFGAR